LRGSMLASMEDKAQVKAAKTSNFSLLLASLAAVILAALADYLQNGERGWQQPGNYVLLIGLIPFIHALIDGWVTRHNAREAIEKQRKWKIEFAAWRQENLPKEKLIPPPRIRPATRRPRRLFAA